MTETTGYNIRPLLTALVDAGFISETGDVERVVIDIEGGYSPRVYVQYAGDPDIMGDLLARVTRSMPIVETSTQKIDPRVDALQDTTVLYGRITPDGAFEIPPGARFHRLADVQPPATHREDALGYAAAVEQQRRGEGATVDDH